GADGPNAFDCSGLTHQAYLHGAHKDIGRTTWMQLKSGHQVGNKPSDWLPGDLIFTHGGGHVLMWLGGGKFINAPHTGANVRTGRGAPGGIREVRRYIGGGQKFDNGTASRADGNNRDSLANGSSDPTRST